jgi:NAD(P)H-flavin reductase
MIAGGTGITPILQVINAVLKDPEDTTQISLLYANQTPDDILLRAQLDALAAKHDNFRVWHTVSRPREGEEWPYSTGYISEDMIREHLFPAGPAVMCGLCGPPAMINVACLPNLKKLGYTDEQCVIF